MDDLQLIIRAQAGDGDAFTALVARHQAMLYRLCYRMTGNAADAEDLAHEAFVEAFIKLGQLREAERFVPWLRAIALNLFRMALRRARPEAELSDEIPAVEAGEDLLAARLARGLSRLSSPHRLALVLHYVEGLSYEELATFLDVPIGTVMSRLHRGRAALKQQVTTMTDEEIPMMADDIFTSEVQSEIAVLLAQSGEEPAVRERLSVLLARSPEHFAHLIANAADSVQMEHLAVLVRRLGRPAIEVALVSAYEDETMLREQAVRLLQTCIARIREGGRGGSALTEMPPFPAYLLADALLRATADATAKAELLARLLDASTDEQTTMLLTMLLLSDADAALPPLLARFWRADSVPVPVLAALGRIGTRFMAVLLEALSSGDAPRQARALAGLEAYARCRYSRHTGPLPHAIRTAPKWAPIPAAHIDAAVEASALARAAVLLEHPDADIREAAARVLGLLQATAYRTQVEALAGHATPSTRIAALRALADLEEPAALPVFQAATTSPVAAERVVAIEAIGRLGSADAEPVLAARLDDPDAAVRKAAITALGDVGGEAARARLEGLRHAADREMVRAAALTLHTSPHFRRQPAARPVSAESTERSAALRAWRVGDANPPAFISLHEAIAALPEVRPYPERELTQQIARVCIDYSTTRRQLVMDGLLEREHGIYTLTELGQAVWRVERHIAECYLR